MSEQQRLNAVLIDQLDAIQWEARAKMATAKTYVENLTATK